MSRRRRIALVGLGAAARTIHLPAYRDQELRRDLRWAGPKRAATYGGGSIAQRHLDAILSVV